MEVLPGAHPPAGVQGVDEWGAVAVVLAADGLPGRIRTLAGWAQAARAGRAGAAAEEAFAAAHRAHVAATAAEVAAAAETLVRREPAARSAARREPVARSAGERRSVPELLEFGERAMAELGSGPPAGVGRSVSAPVTITLAPPSTLRCTLDERWAAAVGPEHAEAALAAALAAARRDLATSARASTAATLPELTAAIIDQLDALRGRP